MSSVSLAKETDANNEASLPSLSMLPVGSVLTNVELPRYDKNLQPKSLLEAYQLTVVSDEIIRGNKVKVSLFRPNRSLLMKVDFEEADYNHFESLLKSQQQTHIQGEQFTATGQGLIMDWTHQQGLLIGPATTQFLTDQKTTKMQPFSSTNKSLIAALSSILFTSQLLADPNELSKEQQREFTRLTSSIAAQHQALYNEGNDIRAHESKRDKTTNLTLTSFLARIGKTALLSQVNGDTQPVQQPQKPQPALKNTTQIECSGGMFFDMETGILCYLRDIKVTGLTKDNYSLSCSQELKIYLDSKKLKNVQEGNKAKKDTTKKEKLKKSLNDIVAIGDVLLKGKDSKGQKIEIKAEKAHYNAQKEEILLEGGNLSIQQGNNIQRIKKPTTDAWIRIDKHGNVSTSKHPFIGIYQTNQ